MKISNPIRAIRDTPIMSGAVIILSMYCFWLGYDLIHYTSHYSPERLVALRQPINLMSITSWGWCFIGAGCVGLLRSLFQTKEALIINFALHMLKMVVIVGWALALDTGPASTGQPAYTFVAFVSFVSFFIPQIIANRYGYERPSLEERYPNK